MGLTIQSIREILLESENMRINATRALRVTRIARQIKRKLTKAELLERLENQIALNTANGIDFAYLNIPLRRFSKRNVAALIKDLEKAGYRSWCNWFPKQFYLITVMWNEN